MLPIKLFYQMKCRKKNSSSISDAEEKFHAKILLF